MPSLEVRNLTMQFPAVRALSDVSLEFAAGEVHGVIGENGAGKSTLMKILSGVQQPTQGEILLDKQRVIFANVRTAVQHGIGMIHQELNLVDELTAADNIFLGHEFVRGIVIDREKQNAAASDLLRTVGADFPPTVLVSQLNVAGKQLVEIAKALALNASILIMDEPTAVLSEVESQALFARIRELQSNGVTVLYISHRLQEVCDLCDRISVLRDGELVKTLDAGGANPALLADLMVGREMSDFFPLKVPYSETDSVLQVNGLRVAPNVTDVSFSVGRGEILGLAGLVGAGRTEVCEGIVGARRVLGGDIKLSGQPVRIRNPKQAIKHRLAYVSEDRKAIGLILSLCVTDNITMASLDQYGAFPSRQEEQQAAERCKEQLDIRASDLNQAVLYLSGGNQQKVSIAKWLETKPVVLILDEPTRGVDVGAKRQMYEIIQRLAGEGLACIVISSELQEIIGLCHRAVVMRDGQTVGELSGAEMTEESLMRLAAGVAA